MAYTFKGMRGGTLWIESGLDSIIVRVKSAKGLAVDLDLDPACFGDVAAALWECSPAKQPIRITQGDVDERAHTPKDGGSQSAMPQPEADSSKEASNQGIGQGSPVDTRTETASQERG